jgi:hypothetical protein
MDREKNLQWNGFLNMSGLSADARSLQEITEILVDFLMPVSHTVADQSVFDQHWKPAGTLGVASVLRSRKVHEAKINNSCLLHSAKRVLS